MRMMRLVLVLVLAATTASCGGREVAVQSTAPVAVTTLDPVGMYDFTASLGTETRNGTIDIRQSAAGRYIGEARLEGESDPAVIDSVQVSGNRMIIDATPPGTSVTFELEFTGSDFTGFAFADGDAIPLTGSKRAP